MPKYIAIIISILVIGCTPADIPPPGPPQPLTLAYTLQPENTLIHIALDKGYFQQEGLAIQPQVHSFGKSALQAVIDGQADLATAAETPIMFNVLGGKPLAILGTIVTSNENNAVIARRDAGIDNVRDLKGKRIGYTAGTTGDFYLHALLNVNGLTRAQITLVNLHPSDMLNALQTKQIDATATWNYPLQHIRQALGSNAVMFIDREIYTETFNITALQPYTDAHTETIKRFLQALLKAEKFLVESKTEAEAISARVTQTDLRMVRSVWPSFQHRLQLQPTLLYSLEDQSRWAVKNQLSQQTEIPNFLDYIQMGHLHALKPSAVQVR